MVCVVVYSEEPVGRAGGTRLSVEYVAAGLLIVVGAMAAEDELLGCTVTVTVEIRAHPPLTHSYPGMQQPPPKDSGQVLYPTGQEPTGPEQDTPAGQQPTAWDPDHWTSSQTSPAAQQLSGLLIDEQPYVPPGHWKSLLYSLRKKSRAY